MIGVDVDNIVNKHKWISEYRMLFITELGYSEDKAKDTCNFEVDRFNKTWFNYTPKQALEITMRYWK